MSDEIFEYVEAVCTAAKAASVTLANSSAAKKNAALLAIADALVRRESEITSANAADLGNAEANGVPKTMLDRLKLDSARIAALAGSLRDLWQSFLLY
jgi:glutamate-5-semialdehyde dehydrogenase